MKTKSDFNEKIGIASSKLGSINAAGTAIILDKKGNMIGRCMDTPNNVAYAFKVCKKAHTVKGLFKMYKKDKEMKDRMISVMNSDYERYHKPYVRIFE